MPAVNLDWTAIVLGGLTLAITGVGWIIRRSFSRLDKHMERTERFMADSGTKLAVMDTRIDNHEKWIGSVESRVNLASKVGEIHSMTRDIHERGCGPAIQLERGTA